jgi:tryptophan-rich hypothetical protein
MTPIHPKKLIHSKWTAVSPQHKEKHFMITQVEFDDEGNVELCVIQAVMTKREEAINWRDLKNTAHWKQGWK